MTDGFLHWSELQLLQKCAKAGNGELRCLINIDAAYSNCQGTGFQALALAGFARRNAHKSLILCLGGFREGLLVAALHIADQSLKCHRIYAFPSLALIVHLYFFSVGSVQEHVLNLLRIVLKRCVQIKMIFLTQGIQDCVGKAVFVRAGLPAHYHNGTPRNT